MEIEKNIQISSKYHTKPIITDVFYRKTNLPKPIVIFCHGYKGFKDWGAWNLVAQKFAENNLFFVKFNFSHNGGTAKNPIDFPDLDAFGENNYILELQDLDNVLDTILATNAYKNEIDKSNITLIGHSRGGGIVVLKAAENKKVTKVITWAGVSDFASRFPSKEELQQWKEKGVAYILNSRTNQKMPHKYQFYTSFKENETRLNIKLAVENLKIPYLIVQGTADDRVLPIEGLNLHKWNAKSTLFLVENMNHTLGSSHPCEFDKLPDFLEQVSSKSIEFILKNSN